MDDRFRRLEAESRPPIKNPPSYYFDKNLFFTFITDSYGVANRHWIGLSQMLWSSDYAHTGTDWPAPGTPSSATSKACPRTRRRRSWRTTSSGCTASHRLTSRQREWVGEGVMARE